VASTESHGCQQLLPKNGLVCHESWVVPAGVSFALAVLGAEIPTRIGQTVGVLGYRFLPGPVSRVFARVAPISSSSSLKNLALTFAVVSCMFQVCIRYATSAVFGPKAYSH